MDHCRSYFWHTVLVISLIAFALISLYTYETFVFVVVVFVVLVRFPVYNPRRLKKWLTNMKWEDWSPSRFSVLCIDHFEEHHIDRSGKFIKLRDDAVPTIFSTAGDAEQRKVRERPNIISTGEMLRVSSVSLPFFFSCRFPANSEEDPR